MLVFFSLGPFRLRVGRLSPRRFLSARAPRSPLAVWLDVFCLLPLTPRVLPLCGVRRALLRDALFLLVSRETEKRAFRAPRPAQAEREKAKKESKGEEGREKEREGEGEGRRGKEGREKEGEKELEGEEEEG